MTNTPKRFHERLQTEQKFFPKQTLRPNHYIITTEGMDRLIMNPVPSYIQQVMLRSDIGCLSYWSNENTLLLDSNYVQSAIDIAARLGLEATLCPAPKAVTAYETTGAPILSDVEDLLDYWNTCLNDKQKLYCLLCINFDFYMTPKENLDGTTDVRINPYTGNRYGKYDIYNLDPYVALFSEKLKEMSDDDHDLAIELVRHNAYTDHAKAFHTGKPDEYFAELLNQTWQLTNLLYEVTDKDVAEKLQLKSFQHTYLCKAVSDVQAITAKLNVARLSNDTTPYTEANDCRYNGPTCELTFDELITFYNDELSKKDQEVVYEILNSGDLLKPSTRDMVATFMSHVRNLSGQELIELVTLVNFHHVTQADRLFDMTDRKAAGTSMLKQIDSITTCLAKYHEHLKIQKDQDKVYMDHIGHAHHHAVEIGHILSQVFKYSL